MSYYLRILSQSDPRSIKSFFTFNLWVIYLIYLMHFELIVLRKDTLFLLLNKLSTIKTMGVSVCFCSQWEGKASLIINRLKGFEELCM